MSIDDPDQALADTIAERRGPVKQTTRGVSTTARPGAAALDRDASLGYAMIGGSDPSHRKDGEQATEGHVDRAMPGDEVIDSGRLKELQASANSTAAHVRNVFFFFLTYGLYLAVTIGATTHEQLLREAPVTLPILNVAIPLFGFYWVAPALFVLLHFNLMLQLYLLARKLRTFEQALAPLPKKVAQREYLSGLDTFAFSHMLIGRQHSLLFRTFFRLIVWIAVIILPVVLLLGVQVRFLPYHDAATTMFHRAMVVLDLVLLWIIWRRVVGGSKVASGSDRRDAANGVFRTLSDWWRASHGAARWARETAFAAPTAVVLLSSLFLFTFPGDPSDPELGDPLEEMLLSWLEPGSTLVRLYMRPHWHDYLVDENLAESRWTRPSEFRLTSYVFKTFSRFLSRNLEVTETNLVTAWPTKEQIEEFGEDEAWRNFGASVSLRGRDLRYGGFFGSTLVHADLKNANLQGAGFHNANLQGAFLQDANLQGARLPGANLQGAFLFKAKFQGAFLQDANLQGAVLAQAKLQRASLYSANLQGADLSSANLQGASLSSANLRGASLSRANLRGASLSRANLQGAALDDVDLQGAYLRWARVWQTLLSPVAEMYRLSDWRDLNLDPPLAEELDQWIATAKRDEGLPGQVADNLEELRRRLGNDWAPAFPPGLAYRSDVLLGPGPEPDLEEFDRRLADFLIKPACADDAPPSVAERLAWRALFEQEDGRLYPALLAKALVDTERCPPAKALSERTMGWLEELRADNEQDEPETPPRAESSPSPLVDVP